MTCRFCRVKISRQIFILLIGFLFAINTFSQEITDTIGKPTQFAQDSLEARQQFIRDSLLARELFVRDSIQRRQRRLDSLIFMQKELQVLLEAYQRTVKDDIFLHDYEIKIIGDSILSDYSYLILPFSITQPFTPWRVRLSLNRNSVKIAIDKQIQRITSIQAPFIKCSFTWGNSGNILIMHERGVVQKNGWGQFYTIPVDSVFFDRFNRIVKIKKYVRVYTLSGGNGQGVPLFLNLTQVKQYEYGPDHQVTQCQVVRFCERWKTHETNKVCSIITYTFSVQNNALMLTRRNDPANSYSDGTYTYEFDDHDVLKSISFHNLANTENWQRTIELNKDGYVHCYFDKVNGVVQQSICMIYHMNDPNAKYQVETVTTTFEKNGISYYQKNNTTGQSRTRDRMTLEWTPWK